ncbi:methyltransferase type 11 [Bordetella sp. H567]|uniref:class I SAM-dependent methyltransferase n=1 Tax=Bordetella sp. H567 TaxID=1697043 RepID=UPI00081C3A14|nr:methyltransferase domain-containing protein [Bordetella sp. H567]AOB29956.1 methyltransferase type 11 [Bordetella sp. H567]
MAEESAPIVELAEWFQTPPGQYVLRWEQAQFDAVVADVFGYNALQVGLAELDLLRNNRMPFKAYVGTVMPEPDVAARWQACALADPHALPFASQSIDLLVLPHAFECTEAPHDVLREVERVLMPEGRVVISGFNPWSLWGARNRMPGMEPWLPHAPAAQVSLARVKDWLKLLSFEVDRGRFGCYAPACQTDIWLQRWRFMEKAGDRWWAVCGAIYMVSAVKRVAGMRLIGPAWKQKRKTAPAASVVANHRSGPVEPV